MFAVGGREPDREQSGRLSSEEVSDDGRSGRAAHLTALLKRCARGHEDALAELYDLTADRIYGLVLRVLWAPDLAIEVTHEVYVEVWRQAAQQDPTQGGALAWMTELAHRRAVDRVRSLGEAEHIQSLSRLPAELPTERLAEPPDTDFDRERIRRGLATLTPMQREALTLAYFGGYSQREVARLLEVPTSTVKARIRDGLIKLRDAWGVET